jgi:hypothetical protein
VSIPSGDCSTSEKASNYVEAAVLEEISGLSSPRPGLVAAAVAMARVLDNARAVSSHPPAAGRLMQALELLWKSSPVRNGKLRLVKAMAAHPRRND